MNYKGKKVVLEKRLNEKETRAVLLQLVHDRRSEFNILCGKISYERGRDFSKAYKDLAVSFLKRDEKALDEYQYTFLEKNWAEYLSNKSLFEYYIYLNKVVRTLDDLKYPTDYFFEICEEIMKDNMNFFEKNVSFATAPSLTPKETKEFNPQYYTNRMKVFFKFYLEYKEKQNKEIKNGYAKDYSLLDKDKGLDFGRHYSETFKTSHTLTTDYQKDFINNLEKGIERANQIVELESDQPVFIFSDEEQREIDDEKAIIKSAKDFLNVVAFKEKEKEF